MSNSDLILNWLEEVRKAKIYLKQQSKSKTDQLTNTEPSEQNQSPKVSPEDRFK